MRTTYLDLMTGPNREPAILAVTSDCFSRAVADGRLAQTFNNGERSTSDNFFVITQIATVMWYANQSGKKFLATTDVTKTEANSVRVKISPLPHQCRLRFHCIDKWHILVYYYNLKSHGPDPSNRSARNGLVTLTLPFGIFPQDSWERIKCVLLTSSLIVCGRL